MSDAITGVPFLDHALEHLASMGGAGSIVFFVMRQKLREFERLKRSEERSLLWRRIFRRSLREQARHLNRTMANAHYQGNFMNTLGLHVEQLARAAEIDLPKPSPSPEVWHSARVDEDVKLDDEDTAEKETSE